VRYRKTGLLAEAFVEVLEQRTPASEDDPLVDDVRRQLGRGLFEGVPDGVDDGGNDFSQSLTDFFVRRDPGP
jgi:hypothetical protein